MKHNCAQLDPSPEITPCCGDAIRQMNTHSWLLSLYTLRQSNTQHSEYGGLLAPLVSTLPERTTHSPQLLATLLTALLQHRLTYTLTTVSLLFWNMSWTTRLSRYQKGKTRKAKTNLALLVQEIVSGSGICWAICNANSRQPPARCPRLGDTWVHLFPHSTHPQSSYLHGAVKAGSLSEIEKRALPPPCFPSFNFQSTPSQGATLTLLPPVLT